MSHTYECGSQRASINMSADQLLSHIFMRHTALCTSRKRDVLSRLFCGCLCLFYGCIRLFCGTVCLICGCVCVFCRCICLFCGYMQINCCRTYPCFIQHSAHLGCIRLVCGFVVSFVVVLVSLVDVYVSFVAHIYASYIILHVHVRVMSHI